MKHIITAIAFSISCSAAFAAPHDYQRQIGSSELDPSIWEGPEMTFEKKTPSNFVPSVIVLYQSANVDGIADFPFKGTIVKSGPSRVSLYEVYRGSPEGTGYQDYFAQFPAPETEESAIADSSEADPDNV